MKEANAVLTDATGFVEEESSRFEIFYCQCYNITRRS